MPSEDIFSKKKIFFWFILIQISHNLRCTKDFSKFWLMITLISSKKLGGYKIMRNTVTVGPKNVTHLNFCDPGPDDSGLDDPAYFQNYKL